MIRALLPLAIALAVAGCGQKGPLKLPGAPAPAQPVPAAPQSPPSSP